MSRRIPLIIKSPEYERRVINWMKKYIEKKGLTEDFSQYLAGIVFEEMNMASDENIFLKDSLN